jgi:hypothetical protein
MDTQSLDVEMETPEEGILGTSSKKGVSKNPKVQKLNEEIVELKVLERHLKRENETLRKLSLKVGSALDRLAIKYETVKHKNKKFLKHNNRLQDMNKVLRFKLAHKKLKPKAHLSLVTLAEAALDFK